MNNIDCFLMRSKSQCNVFSSVCQWGGLIPNAQSCSCAYVLPGFPIYSCPSDLDDPPTTSTLSPSIMRVVIFVAYILGLLVVLGMAVRHRVTTGGESSVLSALRHVKTLFLGSGFTWHSRTFLFVMGMQSIFTLVAVIFIPLSATYSERTAPNNMDQCNPLFRAWADFYADNGALYPDMPSVAFGPWFSKKNDRTIVSGAVYGAPCPGGFEPDAGLTSADSDVTETCAALTSLSNGEGQLCCGLFSQPESSARNQVAVAVAIFVGAHYLVEFIATAAAKPGRQQQIMARFSRGSIGSIVTFYRRALMEFDAVVFAASLPLGLAALALFLSLVEGCVPALLLLIDCRSWNAAWSQWFVLGTLPLKVLSVGTNAQSVVTAWKERNQQQQPPAGDGKPGDALLAAATPPPPPTAETPRAAIDRLLSELPTRSSLQKFLGVICGCFWLIVIVVIFLFKMADFFEFSPMAVVGTMGTSLASIIGMICWFAFSDKFRVVFLRLTENGEGGRLTLTLESHGAVIPASSSIDITNGVECGMVSDVRFARQPYQYCCTTIQQLVILLPVQEHVKGFLIPPEKEERAAEFQAKYRELFHRLREYNRGRPGASVLPPGAVMAVAPPGQQQTVVLATAGYLPAYAPPPGYPPPQGYAAPPGYPPPPGYATPPGYPPPAGYYYQAPPPQPP